MTVDGMDRAEQARGTARGEAPLRSVITCDLDGKIETFNAGAQALFGYAPEEVIGRKRVSLFSPGEVVLGHVGGWLAAAVREGAFETDTVFLRRDGTPFAAHIRITPTFRGGRQIGYCGVTVPIDRDPAEVMPRAGIGLRLFKWLVITRAPFLSATVVGVLVGAAAVYASLGALDWGLLALVLLGTAALHLFGNTANDYFDWRSGADQANADYVIPFSGGSRAIELGLITPSGLLRLAFALLACAAATGLALVALRPAAAPGILAVGALGALSAYFYTAPPLRLAARKGLGELFIGLTFGPLLTLGTATVLRGELRWTDALVGLPVGLLTAGILWINEFPDIAGDRAAGKLNLVATLGWRRARWGFVALLGAAALAVVALALGGAAPLWAVAALAAAPLAWRAVRILFGNETPAALKPACAATIQTQLAAGVLFAAAFLLPS